MTMRFTNTFTGTPTQGDYTLLLVCRRCGRNTNRVGTLNESGYCAGCSLCQNCGERPWTGADEYFRCDQCKCLDCHSPDVRFVVVHEGTNRYVCHKCYAKRCPDTLCRKCYTNRPTIRLRGHDKPHLCRTCALGAGARHHCSHCGVSGATSYDGLGRISCRACLERPSCMNGKCEPLRQCKRHREAQKEQDAQQVLQEAADLRHRTTVPARQLEMGARVLEFQRNPHRHRMTRAGGHIARVANCEACVWDAGHPDDVRARGAFELAEMDRPRRRDTGIMLARAEQVIFHKAGISEFKRNKSHRFLGAEIEVCGIRDASRTLDIRDTVQRLGGAIVHDGSLPETGFEITTAAAQGDLYPKHIDAITQALAQGNAWIDGSAGLHIHVDCRDFTYDDMRRLLILYSRIEPALIAMQPWDRVFRPSDRTGRIYCAPCGYKYAKGVIHLKQPKERYKSQRKTGILTNVYGRLPAHADPTTGRANGVMIPRTDHYNAARYNALNVHSWFYRGTVESRMHTGTIAADEIIPWGMLWASIVDFAFKTGERKIITELATLPDPVVKRNSYTDERSVTFSREMREMALANLMLLAPVAEVAAYITRRVEENASDHRRHD